MKVKLGKINVLFDTDFKVKETPKMISRFEYMVGKNFRK